jgi:methylmalonyl-CoA mutase, N-terminal domain
VNKDVRTSSGIEIPVVATGPVDPDRIGAPGEYPFTRGPYPTMYRGRPWTMRQYAGFGTASDTNDRFKRLLDAGQTGLSVAFDLPTQMGLDSDHQLSLGEVGKVGVAIDSIDDMRALLDGLPLGEISTSMTINSTAPLLLLLYQLVAEEQGVSGTELRGTVQNDILKEYVARGTYIYPPAPSMRLVTDLFSYAAEEVPGWNTISISGYHIREADRPPPKNSPSRSPTASPTCARPSMPDSTSTTLLRGCRSSGTDTITCTKRWPNSGRHAACGRG